LHQFGFVAANDGNITTASTTSAFSPRPPVSARPHGSDDLLVIDYAGKKITGASGRDQ